MSGKRKAGTYTTVKGGEKEPKKKREMRKRRRSGLHLPH